MPHLSCESREEKSLVYTVCYSDFDDVLCLSVGWHCSRSTGDSSRDTRPLLASIRYGSPVFSLVAFVFLTAINQQHIYM